MPNYELIYFPGRGRAETVRMLLAKANVKYVDTRINPADWPKMKGDTPYGALPILKVDGMVVANSMAICRYLATQNGLAGKNPIETASIDACCEAITDIREKFLAVNGAKKEEKDNKIAAFKESLTEMLGKLETNLKKNKGGNGYFYDKISMADIHFFTVLEPVLAGIDAKALTNFPKLSALYDRVKADPAISTWVQTRPASDW